MWVVVVVVAVAPGAWRGARGDAAPSKAVVVVERWRKGPLDGREGGGQRGSCAPSSQTGARVVVALVEAVAA
eukprot:SAG31_NODE_3666_length_4007_cov_11.238741_4_plen_72_part_00